MIGKTILHPPHVAMVIVEHPRVSLPCAAVVHHNELPAPPFHRCAPNRVDDGSCQVTVIAGTTRPWPETSSRRRRRWRLESLFLFETGFFDNNLSSVAACDSTCSL